MSVNYNSAAKTGRLQVSQALINSLTLAAATGAAANGTLFIGTSSFVATSGITGSTTGVLAAIPLPNAGVTVSGNVLTLIASAQSATAGATGTAAVAVIANNAGTAVVTGLTVGTSGSDINLNSVAISSGQTVTVNSATITHP